MTKFLKLGLAALAVMLIGRAPAHASRLGSWIEPVLYVSTLSAGNVQAQSIQAQSIAPVSQFTLPAVTTATLASTSYGAGMEFRLFDAAGNFLAICITTGTNPGAAVLVSDLVTQCGGSTFSQPTLGTLSSFEALSAAGGGGGAVTLTSSTVTGNVGSSGNGASIVNTGSTIIGSTIAPVSAAVLADFLAATTSVANLPCGTSLAGTLAGVTLAPGVYCFAGAASLTGTLTLNGSANGVYVFKIGAGLTTNNFIVLKSGGTQSKNVAWFSAAATTMTDSTMVGDIFSGAAITQTRGSTAGRELATAGVTLTNASSTNLNQ